MYVRIRVHRVTAVEACSSSPLRKSTHLCSITAAFLEAQQITTIDNSNFSHVVEIFGSRSDSGYRYKYW